MFCRIPCAKDWSELQANIRGRGGSQWIIRTGHVGGALTRPAMRSIARRFPRQKADSSPLKRIRNDKYLKAGSRRGAPRNDKCVKADSVRLREKSPHPGGCGHPPLRGLEKVPAVSRKARKDGHPRRLPALRR